MHRENDEWVDERLEGQTHRSLDRQTDIYIRNIDID